MTIIIICVVRNRRKGVPSIVGLVARIAFLCALAFPGRYSWNGIGRVVAVGDVHGDFYRFVLLLKDAGIIDSSKNWCAGKTHLVQTGDLLDRGPDSRLVMELLMKLEKQAFTQGGAVHCLTGNHEAMNLTGDYRYVSSEEAVSHGGMKALVRSMRPTGRYGWWIAGHNAVIRINNAVFLHAGVSDEYSSASISEINEEVRKRLTLRNDASQILGGDGPLWYRGWAIDPSSAVERALEEFLAGADADFAVIGHTVTGDGIETRFGGRVVMIDTGLSEYYGGPGEYLVLDSRVYKAIAPGNGEEW